MRFHPELHGWRTLPWRQKIPVGSRVLYCSAYVLPVTQGQQQCHTPPPRYLKSNTLDKADVCAVSSSPENLNLLCLGDDMMEVKDSDHQLSSSHFRELQDFLNNNPSRLSHNDILFKFFF